MHNTPYTLIQQNNDYTLLMYALTPSRHIHIQTPYIVQ